MEQLVFNFVAEENFVESCVEDLFFVISTIAKTKFQIGSIEFKTKRGRHLEVTFRFPEARSGKKFRILFRSFPENVEPLTLTRSGKRISESYGSYRGFCFYYNSEFAYSSKTTISKTYETNFILEPAIEKVIVDRLIKRITVLLITKPAEIENLKPIIRILRKKL